MLLSRVQSPDTLGLREIADIGGGVEVCGYAASGVQTPEEGPLVRGSVGAPRTESLLLHK